MGGTGNLRIPYWVLATFQGRAVKLPEGNKKRQENTPGPSFIAPKR